jgi:protein-tyrosine phosphatase
MSMANLPADAVEQSEPDVELTRPGRFLLICTANICRSPVAKASLIRHADLRGVSLLAFSAGFISEGEEADRTMQRASLEQGIDLAAHRSSIVTSQWTSGADLIICMANEHVRRIVNLDQTAWVRTFSLRSLAERIGSIGNRNTDEPIPKWVARLHDGRRPAELLADDPAGDVSDPIGQSLNEHRATFKIIDDLMNAVASGAYPVEPA